MPSKRTTRQSDTQSRDSGTPISWWSWRPGIRPRYALMIGVPVSAVALLLIVIGAFTLLLGILDNGAPPLRVRGTVSGHTSNFIGQLHVDIHLRAPDFPQIVSPTVTQAQAQAIHNGDAVVAFYSPHLLVLYALEDHGRTYSLPGSSVASSMFGAAALLLIGLILFPYPAALASWSWRDMLAESGRLGERRRAQARIIGLRAAANRLETSMKRPGLVGRLTHSSWHGVALIPAEVPEGMHATPVTFSISAEAYQRLHEGDIVEIVFAPHLHYVYRLERVTEGAKR